MFARLEGSSPFFRPSQSLSWSPLDDHQEPQFMPSASADASVFQATAASPSSHAITQDHPKIAYYIPPQSEASEWLHSAEDQAQQQKQGVWIVCAKALFSLGVVVVLLATLESSPAEIISKVPVSLLPWVPVWASLYLISQWFSAWRWKRLATMVGVEDTSLSVFYLFKTYLWGTFFNLCLPGAVGGDLVRVWRLSSVLAKAQYPEQTSPVKDNVHAIPSGVGHPMSKLWQAAWTKLKTTRHLKAFSAVLVLLDRLLGFAVLAWMMSLCLCIDTASQQLLGHYAWIVHGLSLLSLLGVVGTFLLYGAWVRPKLAQWYPDTALQPSMTDFFKALGLSVVVQGFNVLIHWLLYQGFVAYSTSLTTLFSAYGLAAIASVIPLSLGGLGTREGAYALVLTQAHWDKPAVLSFAMMWFVVLVVSGLMAGGLALLLDKIPDDAVKQWLKK
ncbi:MAG: YbhN family protein [Vampirovibrionales bacterium]